MLCKLIYASQARQPLLPGELVQLLEGARVNNRALGITGLLLYCNQSFLQLLEGPMDALERLYEKIARDSRHERLRLLARTSIDRRRYPEWSMGFEHLPEERLARTLPGFKPATPYPLVSADLVRSGAIAETLLNLYQQNTPTA